MSDRTPFDELLDNLIVELHREKRTNSFSDPIYDAIHRLALVVADTRMLVRAPLKPCASPAAECTPDAKHAERGRVARELERWRDRALAAETQLASAVRERDEARAEVERLTGAGFAAYNPATVAMIIAEVDRMRPVVEAAKAWRPHAYEVHTSARERLRCAIDVMTEDERKERMP